MNNESKTSENDLISFLDILSFIWAKKVLILLLVLVFALVGFLYSKLYVQPRYISEAKVVVLDVSQSGKLSTSELAISNYLVNDYLEMVVDRTVLDEVIRDLSLKATYEQLRSCVSVSNPENSRILVIKVVARNPETAQKIADKICNVAKVKIVEVLGVDKVNIFSKASLPTTNVSYNTNVYIAMGVIAALFISLIIAILATAFDDKIKTSDDVEKYLGICTLATIPYNPLKSGKNLKKNKKKGGSR